MAHSVQETDERDETLNKDRDRVVRQAIKRTLIDQARQLVLPCSLGISASLLAYNAGFDKLFYLHDPAMKGVVGILGVLILPSLTRSGLFLMFSAVTSIPFALVSVATKRFNNLQPYDETQQDQVKPIIKELAKAGAALFTTYMMDKFRFDPILSFVAGVGAAAAVEYGARQT
jgi:hypothetical protein